MSGNESHPVRNGIIATVVGGIILSIITPLREFVWGILKWLWSGVIWTWELLAANYSLPGWVLLIFGVLAFVGIIRIFLALRPENDAEHKDYTQDMLYGAKWRWSWAGNRISNLWCFCPRCDAQLVYDDSSCRHIMSDICKTDFICERCENQVIASIKGGNKGYALGAAEREIYRRIRTKEHISSNG